MAASKSEEPEMRRHIQRDFSPADHSTLGRKRRPKKKGRGIMGYGKEKGMRR